MKEIELRIINRLGLHARAAAKLVHAASEFESEIFLSLNDEEVNAKSILGLLTLAATKGTAIRLRVDGTDEDKASLAIRALFENKFGEGE